MTTETETLSPAPSIVLVEDDPAIRTLTTRALQQNGYSVRPAGSAPEMWRALEAEIGRAHV